MVDERGHEVIVDRTVHEDPLRRDARLTGVAESGDLDLRRRDLPVPARFDDDRSVVPELEPDALARGALANAPADVGGTGERDQRDAVMIDDRVADLTAAARDHVQ